MHESGVDLGFDLLEDLEAELLNSCYTLKSKPLTKVDSGFDSSFQLMDTNIKIKPDPDAMMSSSLPSSSGSFLMRTNFKQQLQKEHLMQLEKTQNAIKHMSVESNAMSIPGEKSPGPNVPNDVPAGILKVRTKLENPTSYHLKQQQKKQLREFLNTQQRLSLRPALPLDGGNQLTDSPYFNSIASPASPDVPDSSAASSEVDSLLEDFFGRLDTVSEDLNMFGEGLPFSTTLPTNTGLMDLYAPDLTNEQPYEKQPLQISASCPAKVKREDPTSPCGDGNIYVKDRQKKDNHNMIERRRRYNINDRIRELGQLVPKNDSESKQNKGTILKSSVDYIRRLRREKERLRDVDQQKRGLEDRNRQLTLRVQELELIVRAAGIPSQLPTPTLQTNLSNNQSLQLANLLTNDTQSGRSSAMASPVPPLNFSSTMDRSPDSVDDTSQMSSTRGSASDDDCVIMDDE